SRAWGWMTRSSDTPDGPSGEPPPGDGPSGATDEKPSRRRNLWFIVPPLIFLLGFAGWRRRKKKKDKDIVQDTDDEAGLITKLKKDNEKKRNRLADWRRRLEERAKLPKHDLRRLLGNARDWLKKRWKSLTDRMRRNADKLVKKIGETGSDLDSLRKRIRVPGRQGEHDGEVSRVNQGLSKLAELAKRLAELLKRESEEPQKDLDKDEEGSLTEGDVRKRQEEADAERALLEDIEKALWRIKPEAKHLQEVKEEVEEQVEEKKRNREALDVWFKRMKEHPSYKAGDLDQHLIPMLKRALEKAQLDPLQKARLFEKVHSKEYMFGKPIVFSSKDLEVSFRIEHLNEHEFHLLQLTKRGRQIAEMIMKKGLVQPRFRISNEHILRQLDDIIHAEKQRCRRALLEPHDHKLAEAIQKLGIFPEDEFKQMIGGSYADLFENNFHRLSLELSEDNLRAQFRGGDLKRMMAYAKPRLKQLDDILNQLKRRPTAKAQYERCKKQHDEAIELLIRISKEAGFTTKEIKQAA
ncbi:MAG: hypothetical protein KJ709_00930, partial [Nanoarchaeota archaeon]|nr:hypothetical protein [Nanoarchaeota archaeon]